MSARTLTQYLLEAAARTTQPGYAHILSAVAVSAKLTAASVSRGPLILDGAHPGSGPPGAALNRELRKLATRTLLDQTESMDQLAAISFTGSPRIVARSPRGRYLLLFEALHGLNNLVDNLPVGTTFSILQRDDDDATCGPEDFLQPGSRQVCAGIAVFGPRTVLVLTTGNGVDGFTLDRDVGNFVLTHPGMTIPPEGRQLTVNAGEAPHWPAPVKRYVEECLLGTEGPRGEDFTMRWNASAVVGAYRVLNRGGLFLIPDTGRPTGWLAPLLHTAAPLAFLAEQAGGAATTGTQRLLDVVPGSLSARVPFFFGSSPEVARIETYHAEHERGYDPGFTHPLFQQRTLFID